MTKHRFGGKDTNDTISETKRALV